VTARRFAKLESDPVYNDMLLAFRDADFRLAAYRALVRPEKMSELVEKWARAAADTIDVRNAGLETFFKEKVAAGEYRDVKPSDEDGPFFVKDQYGRRAHTYRFQYLQRHTDAGRLEQAQNAAIDGRVRALIKKGYPDAWINKAIRNADFNLETYGWSVFIQGQLPRFSYLAIELRPELGADFPIVLRGMKKRQGDGLVEIGLIIQRLSGAEDLETVRWAFAQSGARIATMAELNKAALALVERPGI
jgi:hypothetical protein